VKESVPFDATVSAAEKRDALSVETVNVTVCELSDDGPAEMPVAQLTACAPESSCTVWFPPAVKLGATFRCGAGGAGLVVVVVVVVVVGGGGGGADVVVVVATVVVVVAGACGATGVVVVVTVVVGGAAVCTGGFVVGGGGGGAACVGPGWSVTTA
jgi:hypothetical protein